MLQIVQLFRVFAVEMRNIKEIAREIRNVHDLCSDSFPTNYKWSRRYAQSIVINKEVSLSYSSFLHLFLTFVMYRYTATAVHLLIYMYITPVYL